MSGFLLHKAMLQIHRIGEGDTITEVAKNYGSSKSAILANLDTFGGSLGQLFWSQGRGARYVTCAGATDFLKMLGELIKRHNTLPKAGTESDGSFVFARCLSSKTPFMHPSMRLLIQLSRGLTPDEILSEEGWSVSEYKGLRASLHRVGVASQQIFMNKKLVLSDELLVAAQVAEELLPYHMELYAEAQKLPKLTTRVLELPTYKEGGSYTGGYMMHKSLFIIRDLGMGLGVDAVAKGNHLTTSGVHGVLRAFNSDVGCPFILNNGKNRHTRSEHSSRFFTLLDEAYRAHTASPFMGNGNASFMMRYGLNKEYPFMHPAIAMILMVKQGLTPKEIIETEGWDYSKYCRVREVVSDIDGTQYMEKPNKGFRMTTKLMQVAALAEELLPYNKALYAEAQKLPKLVK
jgi:hypothetical protein